MTWQTLIDTRNKFDAGLLGYDGPCDPDESVDGIIMDWGPWGSVPDLTIKTSEGRAYMSGWPAIREVAKSLVDVALQEPGGNSLTKARDELAALKAENIALRGIANTAVATLEDWGDKIVASAPLQVIAVIETVNPLRIQLDELSK